jgi:hypothetical protein
LRTPEGERANSAVEPPSGGPPVTVSVNVQVPELFCESSEVPETEYVPALKVAGALIAPNADTTTSPEVAEVVSV